MEIPLSGRVVEGIAFDIDVPGSIPAQGFLPLGGFSSDVPFTHPSADCRGESTARHRSKALPVRQNVGKMILGRKAGSAFSNPRDRSALCFDCSFLVTERRSKVQYTSGIGPISNRPENSMKIGSILQARQGQYSAEGSSVSDSAVKVD